MSSNNEFSFNIKLMVACKEISFYYNYRGMAVPQLPNRFNAEPFGLLHSYIARRAEHL